MEARRYGERLQSRGLAKSFLGRFKEPLDEDGTKHALPKPSPGYIALSVAASVIFLTAMSIFNILYYIAGNYAVFDLGVSYRTAYIFSHTFNLFQTANVTLGSAIPFTKLIFVPISLTLLIYNSPATLLVDQICVISLGGLALFWIAFYRLHDARIAIILEVAYFLYPGTYGFMTHGGNYQVYFEGFLLLSYVFYLQKRYLLSLPFVILSAATNLLAPTLLLFFYVIDLMVQRRKGKSKLGNGQTLHRAAHAAPAPRLHLFLWFVLVTSIAFSVTELLYYGTSSFITSTRASYASGTQSTSGNLLLNEVNLTFGNMFALKFPYFYELYAPLLFFPLLSFFSIPALAFILVAWHSNYTPYYTIVQQYTFLIGGFLFVGTVDYLRKLVNPRRMRRAGYIILVSSVAYFLILAPVGLTLLDSSYVHRSVSFTPFERELQQAYDLIPENSSVFFQQGSSVPLMNREVVYTPGYYDNQTVDYAVISPNVFNQLTYYYSNPWFSTYWADRFAGNHSYGVFASVQGTVIYKHNYTGEPVLFVPAYYNQSLYTSLENGPVTYDSVFPPFGSVIMSPGTYNVRVNVSLSWEVASSKNVNISYDLISPQGYKIASGTILNWSSAKTLILNLSEQSNISIYTSQEFAVIINTSGAVPQLHINSSFIGQIHA